jgi:hypothetical protein
LSTAASRWSTGFGTRHLGPRPQGLFLGDDLEEGALEVVAVESWEEDFRVIHAMALRKRFGALYEEARAWAK